MDIKIYDSEDPPVTNLYERLLAMEQMLRPSRWDRVLMWFGLKKDVRLTSRPWTWDEKCGKRWL